MTIRFACPLCATPLQGDGDAQRCPSDKSRWSRDAGIWRFVRPDRQAGFDQFKAEYQAVRRKEGRANGATNDINALPYAAPTDPHASSWRIRASSYEALISQVIIPTDRATPTRASVLDLGAGNGWLSNRLARFDMDVVAVDLLTNDWDGLGAQEHLPSTFATVQAEFDHLPFDSGQFDVAVYNASLHYSTDYAVTLRETLRVLKDSGTLVIMDSPIYRSPQAGARMVQERKAEFMKKHGFASDSIESEAYLTYDRIEQLGDDLGVSWSMHEPFYGWRWSFRPIEVRIRRGREPARFILVCGTRR